MAYTPPSGNNVDFTFSGSYNAPDSTSADFDFGESIILSGTSSIESTDTTSILDITAFSLASTVNITSSASAGELDKAGLIQLRSKSTTPFKDTEAYNFKDTEYIYHGRTPLIESADTTAELTIGGIVSLDATCIITTSAGDDLTLGIVTQLNGTSSIICDITDANIYLEIGLLYTDTTSRLIISNVGPSELETLKYPTSSMFAHSDSTAHLNFGILGLTSTAPIQSLVAQDSTSELIIGRSEILSSTPNIISNVVGMLLVDPIIDMSSVNMFAFTDSTATIKLGTPEVLDGTTIISSNVSGDLSVGISEYLSASTHIQSDTTSNLLIGTTEPLDSTTHIQSYVTGTIDPRKFFTGLSYIQSDTTGTLELGLERDLTTFIFASTDSTASIDVVTSLTATTHIQSDTTASIGTGEPISINGTSHIQLNAGTSVLTLGRPEILEGSTYIQSVDTTSELIIGLPTVLSGTSAIESDLTSVVTLGVLEPLDSSSHIQSVVSAGELELLLPLSGAANIDSTALAWLNTEGVIESLTSSTHIQSDATAELTIGITESLSGTVDIVSTDMTSDLTIGLLTELSSTASIELDTTASLYIGALTPEELSASVHIQSDIVGEKLILEVIDLEGSTSITTEVDGTLKLGIAEDFERGTVYIVSDVSSDQLIVSVVNLSGTSEIISKVQPANIDHVPWPPIYMDGTCVISTNVQATTLEFGAPTALSGVVYIDPKVDGFIYLGKTHSIKASSNIELDLSGVPLTVNIVELSSTGVYSANWVSHFDNTELSVHDNGLWNGTSWDTEFDSTSSLWSIDLHPYTGFKDTKSNRYLDSDSSHWVRNLDPVNYRPSQIRVSFDSTSSVQISIIDTNGGVLVNNQTIVSREVITIPFGSHDLHTVLITSSDFIHINDVKFLEGVVVPCRIESDVTIDQLDILIPISGSSYTTSYLTGEITGADEELEGSASISSNVFADLGILNILESTVSIQSDISDALIQLEQEVLSGSIDISSSIDNDALDVSFNGTSTLYSNLSGTLTLGIGKPLDSTGCIIISGVSAETLNIDLPILGRRKTTYDLQYWFSKYVQDSELNYKQLPFLSTDSVFFRNDSFISLLFNDNYDYGNYEFLYREEIERHLWPNAVRERLMLRPTSAQYFVCCDSTADGGINLYSLYVDDFTMLDTLLHYRLQPQNATLTGINYEDLRTNLSKMIYMYLDLKINGNHSLYDHTEMMSNTTDLLEICYESYLIENIFSSISQQGT